MNQKTILIFLTAGILSNDTLYGYNCPSIPKNWDGKTLEASGPLTWSVGKITKDLNFERVSWQAHQAWIFTKNQKKHAQYGYFQCIYRAVDPKTKKIVGKLTVASPKTPELAKLAANSEFKGEKTEVAEKSAKVVEKYFNKDKTVEGAKCTTIKEAAENLDKFPPACEIVERLKKQ